jgi:hypothetical protein
MSSGRSEQVVQIGLRASSKSETLKTRYVYGNAKGSEDRKLRCPNSATSIARNPPALSASTEEPFALSGKNPATDSSAGPYMVKISDRPTMIVPAMRFEIKTAPASHKRGRSLSAIRLRLRTTSTIVEASTARAVRETRIARRREPKTLISRRLIPASRVEAVQLISMRSSPRAKCWADISKIRSGALRVCDRALATCQISTFR